VTATFRRMRKVWRIICIKGNVREIRGHFKEGSVFFKVVYLFPHHSDASCDYYFFSTIGSSHARNEPDKIPAINRKYGAAIQLQVFQSMLSRSTTTYRFLSPWRKFTTYAKG